MTDFISCISKESVKFLLLDFDGVLTTNSVLVNSDGEEFVVCSRSDGIGLANVKSLGIIPIVISTEKNLVVSKRCQKLQIKCYQGVDNKLDFVRNLTDKTAIDLDTSIFVGNDVNDISLLKSVKFPVAVNDCWPELLKIDNIYRLSRPGGKGAVRELCDLIYSSLL